MTQSESYLEKAVKTLASSTGVVTPEVAAQRAQAYILMALVERIDALIEAVREPCPCAHADAHGLSAIQEAKPPADTSWLQSTA